MAKKLGLYDAALFAAKIVPIPGTNEDDIQEVALWWMNVLERSKWIARFKHAVEQLPEGTIEWMEASETILSCEIDFKSINRKLNSLLNWGENIVMRYLVAPWMVWFGVSTSQMTAFTTLLDEINEFNSQYANLETDQVLALCEAMAKAEKAPVGDLRMKIAQWSLEKLFPKLNSLELSVKSGAFEVSGTIDELGVELIQLQVALTAELWNAGDKSHFQELFGRYQAAMKALDFSNEDVRLFRSIFKIAIGETRGFSAMEILRATETVWQSFESNAALRRSWEAEQEALEKH